MRTTLLFFLLSTFTLNSNAQINGMTKLHIRTRTLLKVNGKDISADTLSVFDLEYFETELFIPFNGKDYKAGKTIDQRSGFTKSKTIFISDDNGRDMLFDNYLVFLNFMWDKGYELVDRGMAEDNRDYFFKKRHDSK